MWQLDPKVLLEIAARAAMVYAILLVGIRLTGKREVGQLTPFDLVLLLLISNAVQNAMTGPDTTVTGGLVAAATLLSLNYAVALVRMRFAPFRRFVEGVPVVLVSHGDVHHRNLARERMTPEELAAALREHDVADIDEVELAMLEVDGTVSVIRRETTTPGRFVRSRKRLVHHHRPSQ